MQNPAPATPPATPPAPAAQGGGRGAPPVRSPEVGAETRHVPAACAECARGCRLTRREADATPERRSGCLERDDRALKPDIYTYSLIVDGATITDPANRQFQTSFGSFQTMFSVPARRRGCPGGRATWRDRAACIPLGRRRTTIATSSSIHRPATTHDVRSLSRALPAPRSRRRRRAMDERRRGKRDPRQSDRARQSRADGHGHTARVRHVHWTGRRWARRISSATRRRSSTR